ncbi:MAG: NAD(P)H-dependent oxidoreductase [Sedimentibacter sp.]|uniref:NAD(P)H-dependent oxidoreductase n=1 Tax=Sedimentibacter sp. TaxID=1960295 RepID=UPI0031581E22
METLNVFIPGEISKRLERVLEFSLEGYDVKTFGSADEIKNMDNMKILFAVELGESGINIEHFKILEKIKMSGNDFMKGSVGSVLVNSSNELFSRDIARKTILYANMAGCMFPGRPLSEATGSLKNFKTQQKLSHLSLEEICLSDSRNVVERLMNFNPQKLQKPRMLALHASNYNTSNTLSLWNMVKKNLTGFDISEIHIENGAIRDCKGCSYKACKHYSQSNNCFYGGVMVEEVYPAIINSDVLVMICPNYNDSISANMSAAINRLTALFRKVKFYDKYVYAVIVSGFSGSDIIAQQLISALNINKTFMLPSKFALMETANDFGDVEKIENIWDKASEFADSIKSSTFSAV